MTVEERTGGCAHGAGRHCQVQFHLAQLLKDFTCRWEQIHPTGEKFGSDLPSPLHHFLSRRGKAECCFVKLDREAVIDAQHVPMMFAMILNSIFGK